MKVIIRSPKSEDYDRFSNIMDQVQALHVEWRPDVYKPASPLITREVFEEILKEENWFVAEADGMVVGVLEIMVRHVESPSQVTKDILFISSMAVDQAYRGNGIGHLFFEKAKQLKEERGYDAIELQVNAKNRLAYEMYKNYGFTEIALQYGRIEAHELNGYGIAQAHCLEGGLYLLGIHFVELFAEIAGFRHKAHEQEHYSCYYKKGKYGLQQAF